jgi:Zn-dependent protease with chaperone function
LASDREVIASGEWYPPGSSGRVIATLVLRADGISAVSADGNQLSKGALSSLSISARVGDIPRRINFSDGSLFETTDNAAIDTFVKKNGRQHADWVHRLEQFHPRIFAFAAIVVLLAIGIYRYALPLLVEIAVLVTPPVVPQMMSSGTLSTLDTTVLSKSEVPEERQTEITARFARIAGETKEGAAAYTLNFRDGGAIGPNAFALPDGNIVITDQLIQLADGDDEMISGVLAHEIGHVEYKHSLRQLYRAAGMAALVMLIAGDVGSGVEDILTQGGGLLALSYSRSAERQADQRSVELMRAGGMDPLAIARFFEKLEDKFEDHSGTSMLSTHPGTPERRQAILDYARSLEVR